ncbi:MAG: TonB-dependent receptor [Gemmatimonadales bacterium]
MKQACVSAFARVARWFALAAVALSLAAGSLQAQGSTGKIEGRVRDQAGAPVASAQVIIVGTAFAATANAQGYYFVNNVPAGVVSLKAAFVGYKPIQIVGLKVLAGQTITEDFALELTPIEVQAIVVTATQPLVPRDKVTSKQRVDGEFASNLPVDNINAVLRLQPGVTQDNFGNLSIRGGRNNEAATYIDGAPVTPGYRGDRFVGSAGTEITISTNAFEEVSVTTGATSAEFGNAKSGVISIESKTGGSSYRGSFGYESDEPFGVNHSLGLNRVQGSFGGPIAARLTFQVNGELEGRKAREEGFNSTAVPIFQVAGVDTTVASTDAAGNTTFTDVYNYAIARGNCDTFKGSSNPDIAGNYGLKCSGIRLPVTGQSSYRLNGKLNYTYGTGSRVALSAYSSRNQGRSFVDPITYYNRLNSPGNLAGFSARSNVATLNWTQNLSKSAERALALDVTLSLQQDRTINGPLDLSSDLDTRSSFGGFQLKPLNFRWDFDNFPIDDQLVTNFQKDQGRRMPYELGQQPPLVDLLRNNAYALYGKFGGFVNTQSGVLWRFAEAGGPADNNRVSLYKETRYIGRSALDWQVDRYNRLKLGGEFTKYKIDNFTTRLVDLLFDDAYREQPVRWNGFLEDRLDLGDVVVVGGLRYDYYDSRASRPFVFDTLGNRYAFPVISSYAGTAIKAGPLAGTTTPGFNPNNPTGNYVRDQSHKYLSPHIQVSFPVTDRTNFRLSYSHQVQAPDFGLLFAGLNNDLNVRQGNTNQVYGADLDFGKTIAFEFGIAQAFSDDMVLDVAAYSKDILSDPAARLVSLFDPTKGVTNDFRVLTDLDFGNVRGVDVRLDRRFGNYFNGNITYSYQQAKNTGSDPFTYVNYGSRIVNQVGGNNGAQPPPQGILPTDNSRPHQLAGSFSVTFPSDVASGALHTILRNVSVFSTFRYASGTAYSRCTGSASEQSILAIENCNRIFDGGINGARLPSIKQFDARLTKGFRLGSLDIAGYVDVRNLFNFRNILNVFAATGVETNGAERQLNLTADLADLNREGVLNSAVGGNGELLLPADCSGWVTTGGGAPANCIYLTRAEQRYGDGNGVYDVSEQSRAVNALYDAARGVQTVTGVPRRARLGFEINF